MRGNAGAVNNINDDDDDDGGGKGSLKVHGDTSSTETRRRQSFEPSPVSSTRRRHGMFAPLSCRWIRCLINYDRNKNSANAPQTCRPRVSISTGIFANEFHWCHTGVIVHWSIHGVLSYARRPAVVFRCVTRVCVRTTVANTDEYTTIALEIPNVISTSTLISIRKAWMYHMSQFFSASTQKFFPCSYKTKINRIFRLYFKLYKYLILTPVPNTYL